MKNRVLQLLGWVLAAGILLPIAWDRNDTFWPWRLFDKRFGELPFLAKAHIVFGVLLGIFVLVRQRLNLGRMGSVILAVGAALSCAAIFGWGEGFVKVIGGMRAFSPVIAAVGIVAGLVLALAYDKPDGYRIAATGGVLGVAAAFFPFGDPGISTARAAEAISKSSFRDSSLVPLVVLGLGVLVCLATTSLFIPKGRTQRARLIVWGAPVVFLMVSVVAIYVGRGPFVERFSTWLGMFALRFVPAAALLGIAIAEIIAGPPESVQPERRTASRRAAMTTDECARRLRLLNEHVREKRLAPETARAQRVETLRAAVTAARSSPDRARALSAAIGELEAEAAISSAEATSVRNALTKA